MHGVAMKIQSASVMASSMDVASLSFGTKQFISPFARYPSLNDLKPPDSHSLGLWPRATRCAVIARPDAPLPMTPYRLHVSGGWLLP